MNAERAFVLLFPHQCILQHVVNKLLAIGAKIETPLLQLVRQVRLQRSDCANTYLVTAGIHDGLRDEIPKVFLPDPNDQVIDANVRIVPKGALVDHPRELVWEHQEPDYVSIISSIREPEIVIGGFHFVDCVFNCFLKCEEASKKTWVAPWITDQGFIHHGLKHLGRDVMDDLPELADFDALAAILRHYLPLIDYPD